MKDRASIICSQQDKILLVARERSRWSLPGGTIKRFESPLVAARRELEEETSLVGTEFTYLFRFGGLSKRHFVFFADLSQDASPEPRNEISRCRWFSPSKISTLAMSIPAREIVALFCTHENRGETPSAVIDKPDGC
jgi:8-oxo-dGTP diphosphatase